MSCYSARRTLSCSSKRAGSIPTRSIGHGTCVPASTRPHGKYAGRHSVGQVSHASTSGLPEETLATGSRSSKSSDSNIQRSLPGSHLVDKEEQYLQGHALDTPTARRHPNYGRIQSGLFHCSTQGLWTSSETQLHINILELKAIFLALQEFEDKL